MWQKIKLSIFFSLMILANLAKAEETTTYSLVTEEAIVNNGADHIIENVNVNDIGGGGPIGDGMDSLSSVVETQTVETDSTITTVTDSEPENTAEMVTETTTLLPITSNTELPNFGGAAPIEEGMVSFSSVVETQTVETDSTTTSVIDSESENTAETVTDTTTLLPTTSQTELPQELTPTSELVTENDQIDCVCNCSANGSQVQLECSTQVPNETTPKSENEKTDATTLEPDTTTKSEETSTNSNESQTAEDTTTTASVTNTENIETTSESNAAPEETTPPLPTPCSTPGTQPHDLDCQQYYDCSSEGSPDGSFHLLTKSCPNKQVFNSVLNRCSRDISSCSHSIECLVKGGVADPASNTSYYLCEPRLIGGGFYIFHVECSSNEIFYPEFGKCFVDLNNLPSQIYPPYNWNKIEDIDIVKAELKLMKEQDKLKLKQEKDRLKAEEKLQKQLEKDAKQRAKDEAKVNKEKVKMESLNFVCPAEGNFASTVSESTYFTCITKKDKLKVLVMQCSIGSKFDATSGTCLQNTPTNNNNVYETDDDDEDDD